MDADSVEIRILGCLIEKQRTTPDVYPLTLNALRLACNQSTNRDPVVSYDEETIRAGLQRLVQRKWARLASGPSSRVIKYRHLLDEALGISDAELAMLGVLMLRGAQTPGELKARTERLHPFASLGEVHETLEGLVERALVARLLRRPGQKEERYLQLLGGESAAVAAEEGVQPTARSDVEARLGRLEADMAALRQAFESLHPGYLAAAVPAETGQTDEEPPGEYAAGDVAEGAGEGGAGRSESGDEDERAEQSQDQRDDRDGEAEAGPPATDREVDDEHGHGRIRHDAW
jgi:uncharacterized protein YceH (UPF0502 family)